MKAIERIWPHVFWLCLASGFLGVVIGTVLANSSGFLPWIGAWSGIIGGVITAAVALFISVTQLGPLVEQSKRDQRRENLAIRGQMQRIENTARRLKIDLRAPLSDFVPIRDFEKKRITYAKGQQTFYGRDVVESYITASQERIKSNQHAIIDIMAMDIPEEYLEDIEFIRYHLCKIISMSDDLLKRICELISEPFTPRTDVNGEVTYEIDRDENKILFETIVLSDEKILKLERSLDKNVHAIGHWLDKLIEIADASREEVIHAAHSNRRK